MKILLCSLLIITASVFPAAARSATSPALGAGSPQFIRAPLPVTDADLARNEHQSQRPRSFVDSFATRLGIRNGQAELINGADLGIHSRAQFSGGIDSRGAVIRIRW